MDRRSYFRFGIGTSYLLSVFWIVVSILNMLEITRRWNTSPRVMAFLVSGLGLGVFFAVVGGTATIVAFQIGINPFAPLERRVSATEEEPVTPSEMTVRCPACSAVNLKRRTECHQCGAPLKNSAHGEI